MQTIAPPDPVELLQKLVRFETVNPPGNETMCVTYVADLLRQYGLEPQLVEKVPGRATLVCRIKGDGRQPGLMLQGHIDVVTTQGQPWTHPPFNADIIDGFLWGRGTLDMKGAVSMMISSFLRARSEGLSLPGDLMLVIPADEEAGGQVGARYVVEEHAHLFDGIKYGIGEFGGYSQYIGGKKFYPIQVQEKHGCGTRIFIRGRSGHGSIPVRGEAMARLGKFLQTIDQGHTPVRIPQTTRMMIEGIASALDEPHRSQYLKLLDPTQTDRILTELGEQGRALYPIFHNSISPTIIKASDKGNVIPGTIEVLLDCRLLPGETKESFYEQLHDIIGDEYEVKNEMYFEQTQQAPDMKMFPLLSQILKEADPSGTPVPMLFTGGTDGRFFNKLGVQTYGFIPTPMPPDLYVPTMIHTHDERIPVDSIRFGAECMYQVLKRGW